MHKKRLTTQLFQVSLLVALMLHAVFTIAGNISFKMIRTGTVFVITNAGDSGAYFPTILSLHSDGHWLALALKNGPPAPGYLAPGDHMEVVWPDKLPQNNLEFLQPAMVRFLDQSGVSFGHIAFLNQPPPSRSPLSAHYNDGFLELKAPSAHSDIQASWVLWPQEDGIASIGKQQFHLPNQQPDAMRITWRTHAGSEKLATGETMPAVELIHETSKGYVWQHVDAGQDSDQQQRAAWLNASNIFYGLAVLAALASLVPAFNRRIQDQ